MRKDEEVSFKDALLYLFNRPIGMLNILWILLPIIGWILLVGYYVKIVNEFINGKFQELPKLESSDFSLGFFMLLKGIPFAVVLVLFMFVSEKSLGKVASISIFYLFGFFLLPILSINFIKKQTVSSLFEFGLIKFIFLNFWDYILVALKSIVLSLIWLILILILVGIPGSQFTKNIFLADFYRRHVK